MIDFSPAVGLDQLSIAGKSMQGMCMQLSLDPIVCIGVLVENWLQIVSLILHLAEKKFRLVKVI